MAMYVMRPVTTRMMVETILDSLVGWPVKFEAAVIIRMRLISSISGSHSRQGRTVTALFICDTNIDECELLWQRKDSRSDELEEGDAAGREERCCDYPKFVVS